MHCNSAVCLWSEEMCYFGLIKKNAVLVTLFIFLCNIDEQSSLCSCLVIKTLIMAFSWI